MSIKEKKILFVIPTLTSGGAERVVSILTSELAKQEYDISLLLNERCSNEYLIDEKVKVYVIPQNVHEQKGVKAKLERIKSRYMLTKKINPDITITFLNIFIQYICNIPLKGKYVSTIRVNPGEGKLVMKLVRDIVVSLSNACLVQNNEQKDYFNKLIQKKIYVLPNPIEEKNYAENIFIRESIKKIVTVGRLTKQKNHTLLLNAFKDVSIYKPNCILELYGEGEEKDNLERKIIELGLQNKVFLMGRTNNVKEVLEKADLFVLSSNYEGMPNALLEAMASGVPVISTDCPTGPADIIQEGINGLLTPVNDKEALVNAILAMEDKQKRELIAINGYNQVKEKYNVGRIVNRLNEIIEGILFEQGI